MVKQTKRIGLRALVLAFSLPIAGVLSAQVHAADSEDVAAGVVLGALLGYAVSDNHGEAGVVHYRSGYGHPSHYYPSHDRPRHWKKSAHAWHRGHHGHSRWQQKHWSHHSYQQNFDRYHGYREDRRDYGKNHRYH